MVVGGCRRRDGYWEFSLGTPPSILLFTDASQSGWGTDLQDVVTSGEGSSYQRLGDEGSSVSSATPAVGAKIGVHFKYI